MPQKEARQFVKEEAIQAQAMGLARAIFVEPTPFQEVLREDARIKEGEALGVATTDSLLGELELAGVGDRETRRRVVTTITGAVKRGQLNGIFSDPSKLIFSTTKIEVAYLPDGTELMRRNDISAKEAERRYTAYKARLDEAVTKKRAVEEKKRNKKKEVKREQRINKKTISEPREQDTEPEMIQPKTYIIVIGSQEGVKQEDLEDRIISLSGVFKRRFEEEGRSINLETHRFPTTINGLQDISRLLLQEDIEAILKRGITREDLQYTFPAIRKEVIRVANELERDTWDKAREVAAFASLRVFDTDIASFIPVFTQRVGALALLRNIVAANDDNRIDMTYNFGKRNYLHLYPALFIDLLQKWHARFYSDELYMYKDFLIDDTRPMAKHFINMIDHRQRRALFKELVRNGKVDFNEEIITIKDIDDLLAPLVLPDDLLLKAVYYDILGMLYPMPYVLQGESRETAFVSLRLITEQFGIEEIYNILSPIVIDQDEIVRLGREINQKQEALSLLDKKQRDYNTKRALLQQQIVLVKQELNTLNDPKKKSSIAEKIRRIVGERMPLFRPDPKDYIKGEESRGYKRARERYERLRIKRPDISPPIPKDYTEGENAEAYRDDLVLYNLYRYVYSQERSKVSGKKIPELIVSTPREESVLQQRLIS